MDGRCVWIWNVSEVILSFLASVCVRYQKDEHCCTRAACAWGLARMIHIMDVGDRWLTVEQTAQFKRAAETYLCTYQSLAAEALSNGCCNWKFRPKLHDLCEMIHMTVTYGVNHHHRACFNDEDLMGRVSRVGNKTHRVTFPLQFLKRRLLLLAVRWTRPRDGSAP